jgi:uncharacterized protein (DUF1501 family)
MLTIYQGSSSNEPDWRRRDFLRAGFLGIGGLSLPWLLQTKAAAADAGLHDVVKDKSIVLLFLGGGASHIETFNPNMDQPDPYRSVTGEVKTSLPGVTFGGTFPELAKCAHRMAIVRSMQHNQTDHEKSISMMLTGGTDPDGSRKAGFGMGAAYARVRGSNMSSGLPAHIVLTHPHSDRQYRKELDRVLAGSRAGPLGSMAAPFVPDAQNEFARAIDLKVPMERFNDRRALKDQLDAFDRQLDNSGHMQAVDRYQLQAYEMIASGSIAKVFNIDSEDKRVFDRYDTSSVQTGHNSFQPSMLGRQMLMARRLVEAGAGFVTVQSAGWDMHADGNNPNVEDGMRMLGPTVDKALSAFLLDLDQRGLSDKVLTIITGDFGRTPKMNKNGGRDHWPGLCTLAFAGGGLNMGQVIGRAGKNNDVPASNPVGLDHFLGTVVHFLFDVGKLRLVDGLPNEILRLTDNNKLITELF